MRKANRVPQILRDLQRGYGAQKLPGALRAIDIVGLPSSNTAPAHRQLVKKILPRIKYNNQRLQINVEWIQNAAKNDGASVASMSTSKDAEQAQSVMARLHFDGLPSTEFDLRRNATSTELAKTLLERISSVTGVKVAPPPLEINLDEAQAETIAESADTVETAVELEAQVHDRQDQGDKDTLLDSMTSPEQNTTRGSSQISKII
jgi:hypothetical protein